MRKFLEFFACPESLVAKLTNPSFEQLKLAIWKQDLAQIDQLLKSNAPTHEKNQSILHFATLENKAEAVEYISSHYPQLIDEKNQDGDTPLMLALFSGNGKIIRHLLGYSNQNLRDNGGNTAFIIAAANGNVMAMELMLQECNNAMIRNFEGQTALHRAAYYGQLQSIKFLLHRTNLKLYQVDRNNNNALHQACQSCNLVCIRYMLSKVKDPKKLLQTENKEGKKPIQLLEQTIRKINQYKRSEKSVVSFQIVKGYIFGGED